VSTAPSTSNDTSDTNRRGGGNRQGDSSRVPVPEEPSESGAANPWWGGPVSVAPRQSTQPPANQSNARSSGPNRVTLCHCPPGNPNNCHTITVGSNAVNAHLNHGDTLGACPSASPSAP
jgi:hypothetical protein